MKKPIGQLRLPALISDNMVLQPGVAAPVWGWAAPGEKVTVVIAGQEQATKANADGEWRLTLDPLATGGPFAMTVKSGTMTTTVRNVLAGEVWLGSGQSNMEMTVDGVMDAKAEIAAADYPLIRCFTVKPAISSEPQEDCEGKWEVCSPQTVGRFSAALYFFARDLQRVHQFPVGIINASWGGSCLQAFLPQEAIDANPEFSPKVDAPKEQHKDLRTYNEFKARIIGKLAWKDSGDQPGWGRPGLDCSGWKAVEMPATIEEVFGEDFDGAVWFRREVELPASWAGQDVRAQFGPTTSGMVAYINGERALSADASLETRYPDDWLPAKFFKPGPNLVAIRFFNHIGAGGVTSKNLALFRLSLPGGQEIPLAGRWLGKVERRLAPAKLPGNLPPAKDLPAGPFNGMVAPLAPYKLRGVLWYQGESNAEDDDRHYRKEMEALISSWRGRFHSPAMPFHFVQLANYRTHRTLPADPPWARLREAQRRTLAIPNTAMVVAIDIGAAGEIHPKNKQEVGRRLSLAARRLCYGETNLEHSGPVLDAVEMEGSAARLRFSHTTGGLVMSGDAAEGFAVSADGEKYVWARAEIDGDSVLLSCPSAIMFIRYAWDDNPACPLYNGVGLPASPFQTKLNQEASPNGN